MVNDILRLPCHPPLPDDFGAAGYLTSLAKSFIYKLGLQTG